MRLDDAEMNALKNGKKAAAKMESRIKELEAELDSEQRRLADAVKNLRKSERKIKEMEFQGGLLRHSWLKHQLSKAGFFCPWSCTEY